MRNEAVLLPENEERGDGERRQTAPEAAPAVRVLEVNLARRAEERDAPATRREVADELVGRAVHRGRRDPVGASEHGADRLEDQPVEHRNREDGELRAEDPDEARGDPEATPGERWSEEHEPIDPLRRAQPDLERDAPPHRVPHQVSAVDPERVEEGNRPTREVRGVERAHRLARIAEAGEIDGEDAVVAREIPHQREKRGAGRAEAVEEDDRRSALRAGVEVERANAPREDTPAPRRADVPRGGMEEIVELEGEGEVPAHEEALVQEGFDSRGAPFEDVDEDRLGPRERGADVRRAPADERDLAPLEEDRPDARLGKAVRVRGLGRDEADARRLPRRSLGGARDAGAESGLERIDRNFARGAREERTNELENVANGHARYSLHAAELLATASETFMSAREARAGFFLRASPWFF